MVKVQQTRRSNRSILTSINIPLEYVEELDLWKSDVVEFEVIEYNGKKGMFLWKE